MNTIDWDKIKTSLNEDIKLEDKMLIMPMSFADTFYFKLKSEAMKDTIPIEWIENYISKIEDDGMIYLSSAGCIKDMIKEWEKENARD